MLAGIAACAAKPTPYETLPQLKNALHTPVETEEQNRQHSQLADLVSEEKHLHGMTRVDVAAKIGTGEKCMHHKVCRERGFEDDDWYYEIGTQGSPQIRHRPVLILGFNRFGKVERTFVLRVE